VPEYILQTQFLKQNLLASYSMVAFRIKNPRILSSSLYDLIVMAAVILLDLLVAVSWGV
jgi:hypothetical protein